LHYTLIVWTRTTTGATWLF